MPWLSRSWSRVAARLSNALSSSNPPGTNFTLPINRRHTSSRHGVRACCWAARRATSSKSLSPHSRRAKPSSTKSVGSSPRLARSYTAGISFLRARSPVTPNTTSAHGSGTRGSRRSRGSRSGLGRGSAISKRLIDLLASALARSGLSAYWFARYARSRCLLSPRLQHLPEAGAAVGQVQPQHRVPAGGQRGQVTGRLGRLQGAEAVRLAGHRQVLRHCAGDLQERTHRRAALVELPGGV